MTTLPATAISVEESEYLSLPWDHFVVDTDRPHADAFRKANWKTIRRELLQNFRWDIPEDLEPHWVRPGKVVYWQHVTKRQRVPTGNADDAPFEDGEHIYEGERVRWEDVVIGWQPVGPLSAGNAQNIAHYLDKGFRLRPPREGIEAEALLEAADAQAAVEQAAFDQREEEKTRFVCRNHGDLMGFKNWKGYIQHCDTYRELPDEKQAPPEVLARAAKYPWYCFAHDMGFRVAKTARRHVRNELRKPGRPIHATLQQMALPEPSSTDKE